MKLLSDLGDEVSSARISYHDKDTMRNNIKNIKKGIDDEGRARKNAVMGEVLKLLRLYLKQIPHYLTLCITWKPLLTTKLLMELSSR